MVSRLKVEFDAPRNGWTSVKLITDEKVYQFFPSHVPYDSFVELANALLQLMDGYDGAVVRWNDEPEEREFVFNLNGEFVTLKVFEITYSVFGEKLRNEAFTFSDSQLAVVLSFWKALKQLVSKQSSNEYKEQWREPFPEKELLQLTNKINRLINDPF